VRVTGPHGSGRHLEAVGAVRHFSHLHVGKGAKFLQLRVVVAASPVDQQTVAAIASIRKVHCIRDYFPRNVLRRRPLQRALEVIDVQVLTHPENIIDRHVRVDDADVGRRRLLCQTRARVDEDVVEEHAGVVRAEVTWVVERCFCRNGNFRELLRDVGEQVTVVQASGVQAEVHHVVGDQSSVQRRLLPSQIPAELAHVQV